MADTERTFILTSKGLQPAGPPEQLSHFTRLDAVGVPTTSQTGKATIELTTGGAPFKGPKKELPIAKRPEKKSVEPKAKHKRTCTKSCKKGLISLTAWNEKKLRELQNKPPTGNGIFCPKCGAELQDRGDYWGSVSGTFINVECPSCEFSSARRA